MQKPHILSIEGKSRWSRKDSVASHSADFVLSLPPKKWIPPNKTLVLVLQLFIFGVPGYLTWGDVILSTIFWLEFQHQILRLAAYHPFPIILKTKSYNSNAWWCKSLYVWHFVCYIIFHPNIAWFYSRKLEVPLSAGNREQDGETQGDWTSGNGWSRWLLNEFLGPGVITSWVISI